MSFSCAKNLKSKAPLGGARGEDGPPHGFEVSLVLGSIRGGDLEFGIWGEGELVREVREREVTGESESEGERV